MPALTLRQAPSLHCHRSKRTLLTYSLGHPSFLLRISYGDAIPLTDGTHWPTPRVHCIGNERDRYHGCRTTLLTVHEDLPGVQGVMETCAHQSPKGVNSQSQKLFLRVKQRLILPISRYVRMSPSPNGLSAILLLQRCIAFR